MCSLLIKRAPSFPQLLSTVQWVCRKKKDTPSVVYSNLSQGPKYNLKHLEHSLPQPCTIHEKLQSIGAKCGHTRYKYKLFVIELYDL